MKILIGSPVRTTEQWQVDTFKAYIESLDNLNVPDGAVVDRLFIYHNSPGLRDVLDECELKHGKQYITEFKSNDEYKCEDRTHVWTHTNIHNMVQMRNFLLKFARAKEYDYYFMVDADLVLHPDTLTHLISCKKHIIAECFWTNWILGSNSPPGPNAWDYNQASYFRGYEETIKLWSKPGLYRIGMSGACILLSKPVIQHPVVSYDPIYNVSFFGEDRYFCIRAAVAGFEIWLDTHYPPKHLYRKSDVEEYLASREAAPPAPAEPELEREPSAE